MPEVASSFPVDEQATVATEANPLVTSADLAAWLQVSERTIRRMNALGTIGPKPFKVRCALRWRRETITQWLIESERLGELVDRTEWSKMESNNEIGRPSSELTIHRPNN